MNELNFFQEYTSDLKCSGEEFRCACNDLLEQGLINNQDGSVTDKGKVALNNYRKDRFEFIIDKRIPFIFSSIAIGISVFTFIVSVLIPFLKQLER